MRSPSHQALAGRFPGLLTVVVPRHPAARRRRSPSSPAWPGSRSRGARPTAQPERTTELYVADTIGELGLFYRLAPLVFMGGSLVPHGGQNPIEPAKLGAAILHGPHVHNFTDVYAALDGAGGALPVADGAEPRPTPSTSCFSDPGADARHGARRGRARSRASAARSAAPCRRSSPSSRR